MENIQRHFPFSSSKIKTPQPSQSRSQFHLSLPDTLQSHVEESINLLEAYMDAFNNMCGIGTSLADKLGIILKGSIYTDIAGQFLSVWKELSDATNLTSSQVIKETEMQLRELQINLDVGGRNNTSPENMKIIGMCLASIIELQSQLFQSAGQAFYSIRQYQFSEDALNQREFPEDSQNDKISENLSCIKKELEHKSAADISLGFREHFTSLFAKLTHKTPTSQSRFYVNFDAEDSQMSESNLKEDLQNEEIIIHSRQSERGSCSKESEKTILEEEHKNVNRETVTLRRAIPMQTTFASSDEVQDILQLLSYGTGRPSVMPDPFTYQALPMPTNIFSYGQWKSQSESLATVHYPRKHNFTDKDILPGADQPRQLWSNSWGLQHNTQTLNFNHRPPIFLPYEQGSRITKEPSPVAHFRQIRGTGYQNNNQEFNCSWPNSNDNHSQRSVPESKGWTGRPDSSNSSDDASSNNEHDSENVFSMGLELAGNDLVASVNQRRRHSSSGCLPNFDDGPSLTNPCHRKRSFGDLSYDGNKSKTSTWPLKQALAKSISLSNSNQFHFSCEQLQAPLIDCHFSSTTPLWTMQEPTHLPPSGVDNRNHHKVERKYPYFGQLTQN